MLQPGQWRVLLAAAAGLALCAAARSQTGSAGQSPDPQGGALRQPALEKARPNPTAAAPRRAQAVPAPALYSFFFLHLANLDRFAAAQEAQGKDGRPWRTYEQQAIGLSDDEAATLKRVASECNQALAELGTKARSLAAASRAAQPGGARPDRPGQEPPAELRRLSDTQSSILSSAIAELRTVLGSNTFLKLDRYIQKRIGGSLKVAGARPAQQGNAPEKPAGGAR